MNRFEFYLNLKRGRFAQQINFPSRIYWKGVHTVRVYVALFSLVPRSVTRFVPRRSRKNTREARSPRLCPLCQRRRRNYFAATVDGNAAVWVRRRSREAALACLPRISYFLGGIRDSFPPGEEVGPASSVSSRSWLNWTGEFFSPFLEMKLSRRVSGKKRRFVPGLESKEIGLFEATCCCCVSNLNFDRGIFYFGVSLWRLLWSYGFLIWSI